MPQLLALRSTPSKGDKKKVMLEAKAMRGAFDAAGVREFLAKMTAGDLDMAALKRAPQIRWRKQEAERGHPGNGTVTALAARTDDRDGIPHAHNRIDELRLENERLRRIVTDLLLEKMKIEEKLAVRSSGGNGLPRRGEVQS